jgi:hypothetical protein
MLVTAAATAPRLGHPSSPLGRLDGLVNGFLLVPRVQLSVKHRMDNAAIVYLRCQAIRQKVFEIRRRKPGLFVALTDPAHSTQLRH